MYIRDRSIVLGVVPLVQCAQGAKKNTNEDAGPIGASATARFSRLEAWLSRDIIFAESGGLSMFTSRKRNALEVAPAITRWSSSSEFSRSSSRRIGFYGDDFTETPQKYAMSHQIIWHFIQAACIPQSFPERNEKCCWRMLIARPPCIPRSILIVRYPSSTRAGSETRRGEQREGGDIINYIYFCRWSTDISGTANSWFIVPSRKKTSSASDTSISAFGVPVIVIAIVYLDRFEI